MGYATLEDLAKETSLEVASGERLDRLAEMYGVKREEGATDDELRQSLRQSDWDEWQDLMAEAQASVDQATCRTIGRVERARFGIAVRSMPQVVHMYGDATQSPNWQVRLTYRDAGHVTVDTGYPIMNDAPYRGAPEVTLHLEGKIDHVSTTVRVQIEKKCTCGSASTPGLEGCCAPYCDLVKGGADRG